ncbi:MAG: MotA/TolQ/ExbB proton channel family protein [Chthoniobacteraceae bacterium]
MIAGIILGSLLTLAPFIGLLGTVIGMMGAFKTLGSSGIADPKALADDIGISLMSTATGLFVFPVGVVILSLSLIFYYRLRSSTPPPLPPDL